MIILLLEKNSGLIFKYVSWRPALGSLKLRVKTQAMKCQLLAPERCKLHRMGVTLQIRESANLIL